MKKTTVIIVAVAFAAMLLAIAGCGQQSQASGSGASAAFSESSQAVTAPFATLGDVFAEDTEDMASIFDEQRYVCAFKWGGAWWRVEAALEDGMFDKLNEVWTEDEAKVEELVSPLAVAKAETIDAPTVEELDALSGKTGADLSADGFTFMAGGVAVNGNETDCTATKGSFDYLVTFDGAVADEDTDDPAGAVAEMTVAQVSLQGLSWDALEG